MHADNLVVNDCATRQTIEGIAKLFPHLNREAATALVIKSVNSIDSSTLMISTEEEEVFRILNFVCK